MPSLVLFGQRTPMAGDDLRCRSILVILLRALQITVLGPIFVFHAEFNVPKDCEEEPKVKDLDWFTGDHLLILYASTSLVMAVGSMILEFFIWRTSIRGTPTQPEERSRLKLLCCLRQLPGSVLRLLIFGMGLATMIVLREYCQCSVALSAELKCGDNQASLQTMLRILLISQGCDAGSSLILHGYLLFKTMYKLPRIGFIRRRLSISGSGIWAAFFPCCCSCLSLSTCCIFGGRQAVSADFAQISMILDEYLDGGGTLDVVFSDILAALFLLHREHRERREAFAHQLRLQVSERRENSNKDSSFMTSNGGESETVSNMLLSESNMNTDQDNDKTRDVETGIQRIRPEMVSALVARHDSGVGAMLFENNELPILNKGNPVDRQTIVDGAHFHQIAVAIYGHLFYVSKAGLGSCVLCWDSLTCRRSFDSQRVRGDNLCGCNEIALLRETSITPDCIAYASYEVGVVKNPYAIVIDKARKSIVITIRGTISLEDAVTDITIVPKEMDKIGEMCGFDGRGAYCHAGMLETAEWIYNDMERHGILASLLRAETYSDFKLVVTGHSLGAGCAAILGFFLRPKYPDLRCLCFAPPGCVISEKFVLTAEEFITSYVLESDVVPRLSLSSMETLRDDMLRMIARIKVPKSHLFIASRSGRSTTTKSGDDYGEAGTMKTLVHRRESIPDTEFSRKLSDFLAHQEEIRNARGDGDISMYIPGRIVHLAKTAQRKRNNRRFLVVDAGGEDTRYTPIWSERECFQEIQLTATLLDDHMPWKSLAILEEIAAEFEQTSTDSCPATKACTLLCDQMPSKALGILEDITAEVERKNYSYPATKVSDLPPGL